MEPHTHTHTHILQFFHFSSDALVSYYKHNTKDALKSLHFQWSLHIKTVPTFIRIKLKCFTDTWSQSDLSSCRGSGFLFADCDAFSERSTVKMWHQLTVSFLHRRRSVQTLSESVDAPQRETYQVQSTSTSAASWVIDGGFWMDEMCLLINTLLCSS